MRLIAGLLLFSLTCSAFAAGLGPDVFTKPPTAAPVSPTSPGLSDPKPASVEANPASTPKPPLNVLSNPAVSAKQKK